MVNMGTAGLRKALADLPCCWKLAGGLELCCDQWWLLHNPCGPRPAVLPDLNAGSGASKHSQAALVVEVLDGCGLGCLYIIILVMVFHTPFNCLGNFIKICKQCIYHICGEVWYGIDCVLCES